MVRPVGIHRSENRIAKSNLSTLWATFELSLLSFCVERASASVLFGAEIGGSPHSARSEILNSLIILLELGHDSIQAATCNPLVPIYPKELAFLQVIPSREGVRVVHLAEFRIVPLRSEI